MGKKDTWTPKAIANRQKAKGLGRLRWYCQMCQKQCRDANGFKCHTQSEGHIRQMSVFKTQSGRFMDDFSREFERNFVSTLSQRHNTKRVKANNVYQEMIQDRHHVHMNATYWGSLSAFIKYLGQKGICVVEDTDEGWFITWIDRDPKTLARISEKEKRKQSDLDSEERHQREIQRQMDAAKAFAAEHNISAQDNFTELKPSAGPIQLDLSFKQSSSSSNKSASNPKPSKRQKLQPASTRSSAKAQPPVSTAEASASIVRRHNPSTQNLAKLASRDSSKGRNEAASRPPKAEFEFVDGCWLTPGIVVKLSGKKIPEEMYKKKAVVVAISKRDIGYAQVCLIHRKSNSIVGEPFRVKQSQVETVMPKLGGNIVIVSKDPTFPSRGAKGTLTNVDFEKFCADVKLQNSGEAMKALSYDNVCKVFR